MVKILVVILNFHDNYVCYADVTNLRLKRYIQFKKLHMLRLVFLRWLIVHTGIYVLDDMVLCI